MMTSSSPDNRYYFFIICYGTDAEKLIEIQKTCDTIRYDGKRKK